MKSFYRTMILSAVVAVAAPAPAFAHAFLASSSPAVGSTVGTAPKALTLIFTEALEVPFCRVSVTDRTGMREEAGRPEAVPAHRNELLVPLKRLASGTYTVTWQALSVDTHRTQGRFTFTVK